MSGKGNLTYQDPGAVERFYGSPPPKNRGAT